MCSVLILVVRNWLSADHFSESFLRSALGKVGGDWLSHVYAAIALVSRSLFVTLAMHRQYNDGDTTATDVFEAVRDARHACFNLWPRNFKNPTQHGGSHHAETTPLIAVPRMGRTSKGEVKHHQMRGGVAGLNGRFTPEEQMMRAENFRQAALFWAHGGDIHLRGFNVGQGFTEALRSDFIRHMLSRTLSTTTYADESKGSEDVAAANATAEQFSNANADVQAEQDADSEPDCENPLFDVATEIDCLGTKDGPVLQLPDLTLTFTCVRQLLACHLDADTVRESMHALESCSSVTQFLTDLKAKSHAWIEPGYRPPYCRHIAKNRYYTFAVASPVASARVGYLTDVVQVAGEYYVRVNWMLQTGLSDEITRLQIIEHSVTFEVLPASAVLEPRHVVHCCDTSCKTLGAGYDGEHGVENKYLDNEFLTF